MAQKKNRGPLSSKRSDWTNPNSSSLSKDFAFHSVEVTKKYQLGYYMAYDTHYNIYAIYCYGKIQPAQ